MKNIPLIVERNKDVEHIMHAACRYGYNTAGRSNVNKQIAILITADIHEDGARLANAVEYLNYYDALDIGLCLGDVQSSNFSENDGTWYTREVLKSKKPFLTVIGNHDVGNSDDISISATSKMAFEKFVLPTAGVTGLDDTDKPYFLKLFPEYKVALIGLDNYDAPTDLDENGNYAVHRSSRVFSQKQINWLIESLDNIPKEFHLLVALHIVTCPTELVDSVFTQNDPEELPSQTTVYGEDNILTDIIDAWKRGEAIERAYSPVKYVGIAPDIRVKCDFSKRGEGVFAAYLMGHEHEDLIMRSKKYPDQLIIAFPSTAADNWQNYCSNLPRAVGTKAEDCLTVLSLDTERRRISLVRVGSNITMELTERTYTSLSY